jgi:hypothetical protein
LEVEDCNPYEESDDSLEDGDVSASEAAFMKGEELGKEYEERDGSEEIE